MSIKDRTEQFIFYAVCASLPFSCFLAFIPIRFFDTGLDFSMWLLVIPLGLLCLSFWLLSNNKPKTISFFFTILFVFLTLRDYCSSQMLASGGLFEIIRLCSLFGIIFCVAMSKIRILSIAKIIVITGLIECALANFSDIQFIRTETRGITGTFGADNRLAVFLLVCIPCAFYLITKNQWLETSVMSVGVSLITGWLTLSRAGICLGCFEFIACILFLVKDKRLVIFPILFCALMLVIHERSTNDKIFTLRQGHTIMGSIEFYPYTKLMIKKNFFLGVGAGHWGIVAKKMGLDGGWQHCHSELAQDLCEYGAIGTLIFWAIIALILLYPFFEFAENRNPFILILLLSMVIHSFVLCLRTPEQTFYFALFAGFAIRAKQC